MYDFGKHGRNITNEIIANKIAEDIKSVCCSDEKIELDFSNVDLLTTTCVKIIFSPIVTKYGRTNLLSKISFYNTGKDLQIIISHGLESLLEKD